MNEMQTIIMHLDKRIKRLQEARALLVADLGETKPNGLSTTAAGQRVQGRGKRTSVRKTELETFLREHGASTRKEVAEGSGVPDGTLGYLMDKYPETFTKRNDGKWDLVNHGGGHKN